MRKLIVVPTFYARRHQKGIRSQRSKILLTALSKRYNMPIVYTDRPNLKNVDIALIYAIPYHNRPKIPPGLVESKTKLIGYFEDLACWKSQECVKNKEIMFERYDVIMGACYKSFHELYSQYADKYVYFPNFFFPMSRYNKLSGKVIYNKCLMAGALNSYYPSRVRIYRDARKQSFRWLDVKKIPFPQYIEELSKYFCAIATPGKMENVVAKYLEIPAAGVLMLAEKVMELSKLGLKANIHYIPITRTNALNVISEILSHPQDYIEIRNRATAYIRKHHSEINRVTQFGTILKRVGDNI